jgi:coenzyme F420-reducing hydrogenase delta subunit
MAFLKQHRKAELQLEGRKLIGKFAVSLTNAGDREVIVEFINEMRKQLREFDPNKGKKKTGAKRRPKKKAKRKVIKRRR